MGSDVPPTEVENIAGIVRYFSDGTVKRSDPSFDIAVTDKGSVAWKDVEFDKVHRLSAHVYKPSAASGKFPVFIYLHGGGFCIGSCTWPNCHNYCHHLADRLQVIVVAPNYRLAPESRLPAAIDDGLAAMSWLRDEAQASDGWLAGAADFGRVVVCGDSAGGNIAHHLAVKIAGGSADLDPIRVRGYILLGPFFGGSVRTRSEMECPENALFNLEINDRFWRLSLPPGANRDHPFSNPFGPGSQDLESLSLDPILVVVGSDDQPQGGNFNLYQVDEIHHICRYSLTLESFCVFYDNLSKPRRGKIDDGARAPLFLHVDVGVGVRAAEFGHESSIGR